MTKNSTEGTMLISTAEDRRDQARISARRCAYRIVAECDLLTDELLRSPDRNWSDAFGRVSLSARRLIALTGPNGDPSLFHDDLRPGDRLAEAQGEILAAVNLIAAIVPSTSGNIEAVRAVRIIRDLAAALFERPNDARPSSSETPSVSPPRAKSRVLVADDDASIVVLLQRTLESWGLDVISARNGREALETARANPVDLVLTDIEMPELDGVSLLRELKSDPATRGIPVIVISSVDDMDSVSGCIELGAEDHISKPFAPQMLSARVKASLERKRLHDAEHDTLRRVELLIAAAEAVERDAYSPAALTGMKGASDGLGQLARVFDRMVSSLRSREERLRRRLQGLRDEISQSHPSVTLARPVSTDGAFAAGAVIAGRFEIVGELGQGGMGTVYHARDRELNEDVALKIVRGDMLRDDPHMLERLKSEIRLARKLSHPNIVRAHDLGEWEGRYFITMEKVQGVTVKELIDRRRRLSLESSLAIGTQLCDALAVAHDNGIIHRDIKPANLVIDEAGTLKVMDFGIARHVTAVTGAQTKAGVVIGTPHYMAPELLTGAKPDARSDLFAVGVLLYECLSGQLPHHGDTARELFAAIMNGEIKFLGDLVPGLPPQLAGLVHQQLRFDPAARSASARELGQRLSELEHGPPSLGLDSRTIKD